MPEMKPSQPGPDDDELIIGSEPEQDEDSAPPFGVEEPSPYGRSRAEEVGLGEPGTGGAASYAPQTHDYVPRFPPNRPRCLHLTPTTTCRGGSRRERRGPLGFFSRSSRSWR